VPRPEIVILRRGIILAVSFVIIVIVIAAIVEGSGYSMKIYEALVREAVNAEIMALKRGGNISEVYMTQLRENLTKYYQKVYGLTDDQGNIIPPYMRMWNLVWRTLKFDFGKTGTYGVANIVPTVPPVDVLYVIASVLPRTIAVVTVGELIAALLGVKLGPRIAYRHGSLIDKFVVTYAALMNAVPLWWLAMIFIYIFHYRLNWFPRDLRVVAPAFANFWANPLQNLISILYYITLPLMVFLIWVLGGWLYGFRAMLLRVIREDFVMAAKARGLPEGDITKKYVLRPSLAPVLTSIILALAGSIGGMIITESIFDWPGMGTLYYVAIVAADSVVLMALMVVYVLVYLAARFILEILYIVIDPRVRAR
jgi:peptide/nickel transport system permease protein